MKLLLASTLTLLLAVAAVARAADCSSEQRDALLALSTQPDILSQLTTWSDGDLLNVALKTEDCLRVETVASHKQYVHQFSKKRLERLFLLQSLDTFIESELLDRAVLGKGGKQNDAGAKKSS